MKIGPGRQGGRMWIPKQPIVQHVSMDLLITAMEVILRVGDSADLVGER